MGIRVLVVEDASFMRKRICEEILALGHSVVGEAKSGNEALEMYRSLKPDLVTMDITMRDKDGLTATKEILSEFPAAKILFFTIITDKRYREEAERIGAVGYLNKTDHTAAFARIADELSNLEQFKVRERMIDGA